MNVKMKINTDKLVDLILNKHRSINDISRELGVTRQAIWKRLKKAGVSSRSTKWIDLTCAYCGGEYKQRWRYWINGNGKSFCKSECYYASRGNSNYFPWRHGQRLARAIVAQHFALQPEYVVHHEDGDNRNNDRANLKVFASHSDHMKYHHRKTLKKSKETKVKITPLWDGSTT